MQCHGKSWEVMGGHGRSWEVMKYPMTVGVFQYRELHCKVTKKIPYPGPGGEYSSLRPGLIGNSLRYIFFLNYQ